MKNSSTLSKYSDIIYDFDGTIVDLDFDWEPWKRQVTKFFQEFEPKFSVANNGHINSFIENEMYQKYGEALRNKIVAFNSKYEMERIDQVTPIQKVIKIIKGNPNKKNYVWSNNSKQTIKTVFQKFGLEDYFERIISCDDAFYLKPNPEGFKKIKGDAGLKNYLFIGDHERDKQAAEAVGINYLDVSAL